MLLVVDDELKSHVSYLQGVSAEIAAEFCRIAIEFFTKGQQPKVYPSAAQKLNVAVDTVRQAVEGVMYLFTESAKLSLTDLDFQDSLLTLGFQEGIREVLAKTYSEHSKTLREVLTEGSIDLPHYSNLEWRCDVKLASRCLHRQIVPLVTMKLTLEENKKRTAVHLQTDPTNLFHMVQVLEEALREMKTKHCRRIVK